MVLRVRTNTAWLLLHEDPREVEEAAAMCTSSFSINQIIVVYFAFPLTEYSCDDLLDRIT